MKITKLLCICLVASLLFCLNACGNISLTNKQINSNKFEGKGFSSPQEAIEAYVDALREGDVEKMLSTFAIESYVERFDFESYVRKNPTLVIAASGTLLPGDSAYREQLNTYSRLTSIFNEIRYGYFALIDVDPTLNKYVPIGDEMDEGIEALEKELSGNAFDTNLTRIEKGNILIGEKLDSDEKSLEFILGCYSSYLDVDDFCEVAIEVKFAGNDFLLYMHTVKIDGRWYNMTTSCPAGYAQASKNNTVLTGGFLRQ